jgi:hypothetical protein
MHDLNKLLGLCLSASPYIKIIVMDILICGQKYFDTSLMIKGNSIAMHSDMHNIIVFRMNKE